MAQNENNEKTKLLENKADPTKVALEKDEYIIIENESPNPEIEKLNKENKNIKLKMEKLNKRLNGLFSRNIALISELENLKIENESYRTELHDLKAKEKQWEEDKEQNLLLEEKISEYEEDIEKRIDRQLQTDIKVINVEKKLKTMENENFKLLSKIENFEIFNLELRDERDKQSQVIDHLFYMIESMSYDYHFTISRELIEERVNFESKCVHLEQHEKQLIQENSCLRNDNQFLMENYIAMDKLEKEKIHLEHEVHLLQSKYAKSSSENFENSHGMNKLIDENESLVSENNKLLEEISVEKKKFTDFEIEKAKIESNLEAEIFDLKRKYEFEKVRGDELFKVMAKNNRVLKEISTEKEKITDLATHKEEEIKNLEKKYEFEKNRANDLFSKLGETSYLEMEKKLTQEIENLETQIFDFEHENLQLKIEKEEAVRLKEDYVEERNRAEKFSNKLQLMSQQLREKEKEKNSNNQALTRILKNNFASERLKWETKEKDYETKIDELNKKIKKKKENIVKKKEKIKELETAIKKLRTTMMNYKDDINNYKENEKKWKKKEEDYKQKLSREKELFSRQERLYHKEKKDLLDQIYYERQKYFESRAELKEIIQAISSSVDAKMEEEHAELLEELNAMEQKLNQKEQDETCVVCMTENRTHAFLPCGHYCVCATCVTQCHECPICRGRFTNIKKIYQS